MFEDFSAVIGLWIALFVLVLFFCFIDVEDDEPRKSERYDIASITYGKEVDGHFTLGCGSIDSDEYYYCYRIMDDGAKEFYKMRAESVKIYDNLEANEQPYLVRNEYIMSIKYDLYLPKNSVTQRINVDLY